MNNTEKLAILNQVRERYKNLAINEIKYIINARKENLEKAEVVLLGLELLLSEKKMKLKRK